MKWYKISESELRVLIHDATKYQMLQEGGVDNWSGYGENFNDFMDERYDMYGKATPRDEKGEYIGNPWEELVDLEMSLFDEVDE